MFEERFYVVDYTMRVVYAIGYRNELQARTAIAACYGATDHVILAVPGYRVLQRCSEFHVRASLDNAHQLVR